MDCKICLENYNRHSKKPISINCGHTICAKCIETLKKSNNRHPNILTCPLCRQEITSEHPNYALLDLLDLNLIVDPDSELSKDFSKAIEEIEGKNKILASDLKKKAQQEVDSIKSAINRKVVELINETMSRQEFLIAKANNISINLNRKIDSVFSLNQSDYGLIEKNSFLRAQKLNHQNKANPFTG